MKGRRSRKELEVMGKKKLHNIWLYDQEYETVKNRAKLLGWSISDYVGTVLSKHNAEVNDAVSEVLNGIDARVGGNLG